MVPSGRKETTSAVSVAAEMRKRSSPAGDTMSSSTLYETVPSTSAVAADRRTRSAGAVTPAGTTPTVIRAVAVAPRPLPTVYSMPGTVAAVGLTVIWIAEPFPTTATVPTSAGSGLTDSMTTLVQSMPGSLSSTRSTVARPARTPNSSSTASGSPTGTAVQSGGSWGSSSELVGSSTVVVWSAGPSGGATSAQLSTARNPSLAIQDRPEVVSVRTTASPRACMVRVGSADAPVRLTGVAAAPSAQSATPVIDEPDTQAAYRQPASVTGGTGRPDAAATDRTVPSVRSTAWSPVEEAISTSAAAGPESCRTASAGIVTASRRSSTRSDRSARSSTTGDSPTVVSWMSPVRPDAGGPFAGLPVAGLPRDSGPSARAMAAGAVDVPRPGSTRTISAEPGRVANTVPPVLTATTGSVPMVATGDADWASTEDRSGLGPSPLVVPTHRRPSARSAT